MTEDRKLERNPLEEEAPNTVMDRVEQFAYDLAWGVDKGLWSPSLVKVNPGGHPTWLKWDDNNRFNDYLENKWHGNPPTDSLLVIKGYLEVVRSASNQIDYILTQKALELLESPVKIPNVFVSYRRQDNSALALLVESRLLNKDSQIGVFIDKYLVAGESWHAELEERVKDSKYFICLLGPSSLKSEYVLQEIAWAIKYEKKIITILQPNCSFPNIDDYQLELDLKEALLKRKINFGSLINSMSQKHAIFIDSESAKHYESAINELINALGYSTI